MLTRFGAVETEVLNIIKAHLVWILRVVKLLVYYKENMKAKERMYRFVPRMGGVEEIRKAIGLA